VTKPKITAKRITDIRNVTLLYFLHIYFEIFVCRSSDIGRFGVRGFQTSSIITAVILLTPDDIELKLN